MSQLRRGTREPLYVTLQDVAALAGVSAKTVSRVVNKQGEIKESTRQRIQAAIEELGYRPNILARSLIHQRTNTLAVVAWGIDYFGPSRMMIGIEQQADDLGYSLFLNLVRDPEHHDQERVLDTLLAHRVDGILWAVPEVGENRKWLDTSRLEGLPPIIFLSMAAQQGVTVLAVDNQSGERQATRHLISQGRRKIGLITGPMAWWEARERRAGWKSAMKEARLPSPERQVVESYWSSAGGERAMQQLLKQAPDLDAVCAGSDQIALGALGAIRAAGRSVPDDIAVVGFDNMPESAYFWPPLTTVYQKLAHVGRSAVQQLHQMIEARRERRATMEAFVTIIEPELIVRASSG
ncbi:MAG: LacI family DNA-binding transcriptional regulator [Anaerolineae bacterium]